VRQRGFTLLELILYLGIGSLLLMVSVAIIFQVYVTANQARGHSTVLVNLDAATSRIRKDIYMAQTTDLTDGVPDSAVLLSWTDYSSSVNGTLGVDHTSDYALSGTSLLRTYDSVEGILGRNITAITFEKNGSFMDITITATSNTTRVISRTINFSARLRSEGVN